MLISTESGQHRCWWPGDDNQYQNYHDTEWGRAVVDDRVLFEKICLEGFQSGLSWLTILRKRENFRRAFLDFDHQRIADFTESDVDALMSNAGIVRHRGKIEAVINNARRLRELNDEGVTLSHYVWSFAPRIAYNTGTHENRDAPPVSTSTESVALSKELKKRGWKFVGPTTIYSFMQSMGLVNDHVAGCFVRNECEQIRQRTIQTLFPEEM